MEVPFEIIIKILWSALVSVGFAVMFNTPRRALWAVALLGAVGYGIKIFLMKYVIPEQIVLSSLIGASAVGLLGVYFAHRVHTPPVAFTVPAVINMIPGKYGYSFVIGVLQLVTYDKNKMTFDDVMKIMNNGLITGFVVLALSFGVIISVLIFNTQTVKDKDLHKFIDRKVIRQTKALRNKRRKEK